MQPQTTLQSFLGVAALMVSACCNSEPATGYPAIGGAVAVMAGIAGFFSEPAAWSEVRAEG